MWTQFPIPLSPVPSAKSIINRSVQETHAVDRRHRREIPKANNPAITIAAGPSTPLPLLPLTFPHPASPALQPIAAITVSMGRNSVRLSAGCSMNSAQRR